jgi:hypothetical protein
MIKKIILPAFIFLSFAFFMPTAYTVSAQSKTTESQNVSKAVSSIKTELYFGRNITGGTTVSDKDWDKFLTDVVTPKFPSGLTVIDAAGQFRADSGAVEREPSKILILIYPKKERKAANLEIENIRAAYIKTFRQMSVLRVDSRVDIY